MEDFLNVNLDDIPEQIALENATEAKIEVLSAVPNEERRYVLLTCKVIQLASGENFDNVKNFTTFLNYPRPEDEELKKNNKLRRLKTAHEALGISGAISDAEDYQGKTAWVILSQSEDDVYGTQNDVKRWVKSK